MGSEIGENTAAVARTIGDGRYTLRRLIGKGAAARVYLAHDIHLGRDVAVKMLTDDAAEDPGFVARFHREAQAIASLNHPNIVKVYDWGSDAGTDYLVMEYVSGGSLARLLKTSGPLAEDEALRIAAGIARGLQAAHDHGIVHRDTKPDNVLLTPQGTPKVADFGIARALGNSNLTATNLIFGTVSYVSPEQARGTPLDGRSDLYSLGVVLYEMLAGRVPFPGTSMVEVAVKHVQTPPPPLRTLRPELSPRTVRIVDRALAKSPQDRFPSARAMQAALEDAADSAGRLVVERVPTAVPTRRLPSPPRHMARPAPATPVRERRFWPLIAVPLVLLLLAAGVAFAHPWSSGSWHTAAAVPRTTSTAGNRTAHHPVKQPTRHPTARPAAHKPPARSAPAGPSPAATSAPPVVNQGPTGSAPASGKAPAPGPPSVAGQAPTSGSAGQPASAGSAQVSGPAGSVIRFYTDVGNHDFGGAAQLWSSAMQQIYTPSANIDQRFADTRSIWVHGVTVTSEDPSAGTATVAVNVTETKTSGATQRFTGTWNLVRLHGTWLLDRPNLTPVGSDQAQVTASLPNAQPEGDDHGEGGKGKDHGRGHKIKLPKVLLSR